MKEIKGKFEIVATPMDPSAVIKELGLMHMKFEKTFTGDLNATGMVSMMGTINRELGSGGYVAIEKISGKLLDKSGTFLLQHSSTMDKGTPHQSISVIPDSGTADLVGLRGEMKIDIVDGQHFYSFAFELV